jgi:hypothetical protein
MHGYTDTRIYTHRRLFSNSRVHNFQNRLKARCPFAAAPNIAARRSAAAHEPALVLAPHCNALCGVVVAVDRYSHGMDCALESPLSLSLCVDVQMVLSHSKALWNSAGERCVPRMSRGAWRGSNPYLRSARMCAYARTTPVNANPDVRVRATSHATKRSAGQERGART